MTDDLRGKTALVTGAAQGIGRGIVECLIAQGAGVTIADIDATKGQQLAAQLHDAGHDVIFVQTDITLEDQIIQAVQAHLQHFGGLDILVNNAGRNQHFDASTMTVDEWETAMNLNLRGAWLCAKHALPIMVSQQAGVIINIASVHATMTFYNFFPYNVAKAGLLGLTRSLALDWGHENIRAVTVSPGYVRTAPLVNALDAHDDPEAEEQRIKNLHPLKRIGEPTDIGNLVAFLASDNAQYITGTEIIIDGGISARYAD